MATPARARQTLNRSRAPARPTSGDYNLSSLRMHDRPAAEASTAAQSDDVRLIRGGQWLR